MALTFLVGLAVAWAGLLTWAWLAGVLVGYMAFACAAQPPVVGVGAYSGWQIMRRVSSAWPKGAAGGIWARLAITVLATTALSAGSIDYLVILAGPMPPDANGAKLVRVLLCMAVGLSPLVVGTIMTRRHVRQVLRTVA